MDEGIHGNGQSARRASRQAVSLSFFRFGPVSRRLWAFSQMGLARGRLKRLPGATFVKLMGAGTGEGFTPVPDTSVMAVLIVWPDLAAARNAVTTAPIYGRLRAKAAEAFTFYLEPLAVRGQWTADTPFRSSPVAPDGPLAALTRASIRPSALVKFWRRAPAISKRIGANRDVIFKAGIGEIPWLHQVTFSVWPNTTSMAEFARVSGPHAEAIRKVRAEGWFSEELYARFAVRAHEGTWGGIDPLALYASPLAAE